jgi:hypothetical protein
VPPSSGCPYEGHPSSEVTDAICRVPSVSFSQAPWYILPVHLCRFGVRSLMRVLFPGDNSLHTQSDKHVQLTCLVTSLRFRNINLIPIDYAFQPRLRGRLNLRRLTLRRNPWTFGENVSHILYRYSCQHSHFRYLQQTSRFTFTGLRNAPLPLTSYRCKFASSVHDFSPATLSAQENLFRLVSYYAFFKRWLLLSQLPSCFGFFTSFYT